MTASQPTSFSSARQDIILGEKQAPRQGDEKKYIGSKGTFDLKNEISIGGIASMFNPVFHFRCQLMTRRDEQRKDHMAMRYNTLHSFFIGIEPYARGKQSHICHTYIRYMQSSRSIDLRI